MDIEERLQSIRDAMDLLDNIQIEHFPNSHGEHFQVWSLGRYTIEYWSWKTPNILADFRSELPESEMLDMMREALCRGGINKTPINLRQVDLLSSGYGWEANLEMDSSNEPE